MGEHRALEATMKRITKKIVISTLEAVNAVIDLNTKRNGLVDAEELKQGLTKVFHNITEEDE